MTLQVEPRFKEQSEGSVSELLSACLFKAFLGGSADEKVDGAQELREHLTYCYCFIGSLSCCVTKPIGGLGGSGGVTSLRRAECVNDFASPGDINLVGTSKSRPLVVSCGSQHSQ